MSYVHNWRSVSRCFQIETSISRYNHNDDPRNALMDFSTMTILTQFSADRKKRLQQEHAELSNKDRASVSSDNHMGTTKSTSEITVAAIFAKVIRDAVTNKSSVYCTELDDIMP